MMSEHEGSAVMAPNAVSAPIATDLRSSMLLTAAVPPSTVQLVMITHLTQANPARDLDLRNQSVFESRFSMFESVELISAEWHITVPSGSSYSLHYCVNASAGTPADIGTMQGSLLYESVFGSEGASTTRLVALPDNHPFGRQVKAAVLGNPTPKFHFRAVGLDASSSSVVYIRGVVTVRYSGRGILRAISF